VLVEAVQAGLSSLLTLKFDPKYFWILVAFTGDSTISNVSAIAAADGWTLSGSPVCLQAVLLPLW